MKTAGFLQTLHDRIVDDREAGIEIDVHLAEIAGWQNLRYLPGEVIIGSPPTEPHRLREIPKFTTDVGDAITFIPDKWVEQYNRRFDGTVRASCHPRGDLGLENVYHEDESLIVAMLAVALQARIQQIPG